MTIGAVFDWDGVVIDSRTYHFEGWNRVAAEYGFPHTEEDFKRHFGMKNEQAIPNVLRWTQDPDEIRQISLRKENYYREILARDDVEALDGVVRWLNTLADASIPCVIASSSPRINIDTIIGKLGVGAFFEGMVCGDEVEQGKPNPELFLLAAKLIDVDPQNCVVFEDTPSGIEAGLTAGMRVVAVTTTHAASALTAAHHVVDRLDELNLTELMHCRKQTAT